MIFSLSKGMYTAALLGDKTLTTRLRLPAHIAIGKVRAIMAAALGVEPVRKAI